MTQVGDLTHPRVGEKAWNAHPAAAGNLIYCGSADVAEPLTITSARLRYPAPPTCTRT
jgi:hypothetical protein